MSNTAHYPSLELCKKLTEIGFPETHMTMAHLGVERYEILEEKYKENWYPDCVGYVCPSVMEMLDVIPSSIDGFRFGITNTGNSFSVYYRQGEFSLDEEEGVLPNALAEMVLWLVENNYLSFNK